MFFFAIGNNCLSDRKQIKKSACVRVTSTSFLNILKLLSIYKCVSWYARNIIYKTTLHRNSLEGGCVYFAMHEDGDGIVVMAKNQFMYAEVKQVKTR